MDEQRTGNVMEYHRDVTGDDISNVAAVLGALRTMAVLSLWGLSIWLLWHVAAEEPFHDLTRYGLIVFIIIPALVALVSGSCGSPLLLSWLRNRSMWYRLVLFGVAVMSCSLCLLVVYAYVADVVTY